MNKDAQIYKYRTDHQKFTTYGGDGSGRDAYIIMSDGGNQPEPFRHGYIGKDPYYTQSVKPKYASNVHGKLLKPFASQYYPPDGTGRDSYIIKNHGGTCIEDFTTSAINFAQNTYLRDQKLYDYRTPKKDLYFQSKDHNLRHYSNWPSKEAVKVNREIYKKQVEQAKRLSPNSILYKSESRFLSPGRRSYFKDRTITELNEMINDPIAMAVEINRQKQRSNMTLNATQNFSKRMLNSIDSPMSKIIGPEHGLRNKMWSGTEDASPNVNRKKHLIHSPPVTCTRDRNHPMSQSFSNVKLKKKEFGPLIMTSQEIFNSPKKTPNIVQKNSVINRGAVTQASYPSLVGLTPEYDNIQMKSTMPSITDKKVVLNKKSRRMLGPMGNSQTNFNIEQTKECMTPNANALENTLQKLNNTSQIDLQYNTLAGFKNTNKRMSTLDHY